MVKVAFDNPLTKNYFDQNYTNENLKAMENKILIHSENKKWILVLQNDIYYILYNPLHRSLEIIMPKIKMVLIQLQPVQIQKI